MPRRWLIALLSLLLTAPALLGRLFMARALTAPGWPEPAGL